MTKRESSAGSARRGPARSAGRSSARGGGSPRTGRERAAPAAQGPPRAIEIGVRGLVIGLLVIGLAVAGGWWFLFGRGGAPHGAVSSPPGREALAGTVTAVAAGVGPGADAGSAIPAGAASTSTLPPLPQAASAPQQDDRAWVTSDGYLAVGDAEAPLRIVAFLDYQCNLCGQFVLEELPSLVARWVGRGLALFVFRDLAVLGERSFLAAEAAHCSGEQGHFLDFQERLFLVQGERDAFSMAHLKRLASEAGLDGDALGECVSSGRYRPIVAASTDYGLAQGFEGTPVFVINGRPFTGAIELDRWDDLFETFESEQAGTRATGAP